jgi:glutamine synthetase
MSTFASDLARDGVRVLRLSYADLHGVARGKDLPVEHAAWASEHGVAFCTAIMTTDLRHNVVAGFETGFADLVARPDPATLRRVPWDPRLAWCLADLETAEGTPYPVDPRGALKAAVAAFADLDLVPVVGPELEFYLCAPDPASPVGYTRYVDQDSQVYTVGEVADPRGVVTELLLASHDLELGAYAANQEYGRGQYEINLRHSDALDAVDRAFRFRTLVKELSARHGLLATFIGKPWNDDEGSGLHIHVSFRRQDGSNALLDESAAGGRSPLVRRFAAGIVEHAAALTAILTPTVNGYKRMVPESLAPTNANWGLDNRLAMVRVPAESGASTRVEVRLGEGAANLYLGTAALLHAGLDGIRRELDPGEPVTGNPYELDDDRLGPPLPDTLEKAVDALEADTFLRDALGAELLDTYLQMKRHELARWKAYVTDWEFREYARHL